MLQVHVSLLVKPHSVIHGARCGFKNFNMIAVFHILWIRRPFWVKN
jgi:hypothetical protein